MKKFLLAIMLALASLLSIARPARANTDHDYNVRLGATSVILDVFFGANDGSNSGVTGLSTGSGMTCAYTRDTDAGSATQISLVSMTKGTWTSGGFVEVDGTLGRGLYQFGIPNACLASGAKWCWITFFNVPSGATVTFKVALLSNDPFLASLPNVAAGANGGLPIVGTQIPNATAGASGGLLINGTNSGAVTLAGLTTGVFSSTSMTTGAFSTGGNSFTLGSLSISAGVNITGSGSTPPLTLDASSGSGQAFWIKGNKLAAALQIDGASQVSGSNQPAVQITGGAAAGGSGNSSPAVVIVGGGSSNSNAASEAVRMTGGANSSTGAAGAGQVIKTGTGSGTQVTPAISITGQQANSPGILVTSGSAGKGIDVESADDALTLHATLSSGLVSQGGGNFGARFIGYLPGILAQSSNGVGVEFLSSVGDAFYLLAGGNGDGIHAVHAGSGVDLDATTTPLTVAGISGVTFPANFATLSIDSSGRVTLTPTNNTAIATATLGSVVDSTGATVTVAQALEIAAACLAGGNTTGYTASGTQTVTVTKRNGTTAIAVFDVDGNGNRTLRTLSP